MQMLFVYGVHVHVFNNNRQIVDEKKKTGLIWLLTLEMYFLW